MNPRYVCSVHTSTALTKIDMIGFGLTIVEMDGLWYWFWHNKETEIGFKKEGFASILECYKDAVRWSMTEGPMELTLLTCQVKQ